MTNLHRTGEKLPVFENGVQYEGSLVRKPKSVVNKSFPRFQQISGTTRVELFYDLFFVANLTVFTNVHEVNSAEALKQYIGFFALLWFTWFQVALYDVRFTTDSLVERVAKLLQFGVMIVLAISGSGYEVGDAVPPQEPGYANFFSLNLQGLTLAFMASRFVMVLQYLQVAFFARKWRDARTPLLTMASIYFVTGWIYFGIFWVPIPHVGQIDRRYIGWYVVASVESVVALLLPAIPIWSAIGFEESHLVDRMSLLTLIILGEGVIGLAEETQKINQGQLNHFTSPVVAGIICAIFILYFLYTLYFDYFPREQFGKIWQKIWVSLHFPLHVALVLAVEGVRLTLAWLAATGVANEQGRLINNATPLNRTSTADEFQAAAADLSINVIEPVLNAAYSVVGSLQGCNGLQEMDARLTQFNDTIAQGASNFTVAKSAGLNLSSEIFGIVFTNAGFEPAEEIAGTSGDFAGAVEIYFITFIYFFVAIGVAVILFAVLGAISNTRRKGSITWLRIAATGTLGLALSLLATITVPFERFYHFAISSWVLPMTTLILFAAFLVNTLPLSLVGAASEDEEPSPEQSDDSATWMKAAV